MSNSTTKRVIVDRFDRERLRGFANLQNFLLPDGIEILSQEGALALIPYQQIKAVSFVRDLDGPGVFEERREFLARPKLAGLWVDLSFRDGDRLEGHITNDLLTIDTQGYSLTPPEAAGNAQRVFVPRQALARLIVLGVIGRQLPRRRVAGLETRQFRLFNDQ